MVEILVNVVHVQKKNKTEFITKIFNKNCFLKNLH